LFYRLEINSIFRTLFSNLTVTVMKFGAYFYTGSAAMLSEAIHSLADFANQVIKRVVHPLDIITMSILINVYYNY